MKRREFIRLTSSGMLAASAAAANSQASPPLLCQVRGTNPAAITRLAVDKLGGMSRFVFPGESVLVHPNIGWDRPPELAANTNPLVVAELVRMCLEAGAARVAVLDNTTNEAARCYERSGIAAAADAAGAEVVMLGEGDFTEVQVKGTAVGRWLVVKTAQEFDKLINVPVAKHHHLTRLTLGLKNHFGLIGGPRHELHPRIHRAIAELAVFFSPVLTVIDAVRIMTANGPYGGSLADVRRCDTVIASSDPVAADSRAAGLFGIDPGSLPFIVYASELGLGTLQPPENTVVEIDAG